MDKSSLGKSLGFILGLILVLVLSLTMMGGGAKEEEEAASDGCAPAISSGSSGGSGEDASISGDGPKMVKKYAKNLESAAKEAGIPAYYLAAQIEAESQWDPEAKSPVGAEGLTQFMPGTWDTYGEGDPTDPAAAIEAQGEYLGVLTDMAEDKNLSPTNDIAFASYNAGEGAVQSYGGIPPYEETQNYVKKINSLADSYKPLLEKEGVSSAVNESEPSDSKSGEDKSKDDSSSECSGSSGTGTNGKVSGKDDYPFKDQPHCDAGYTSCPQEGTKLGFLPSECVDFAAWRVNQQLGGTESDIKFSNTSITDRLGNASGWFSGWKEAGWPYGDEPKVGAVIWYDANHGGAGAMGHVAVVQKVNDDGTFVEEGYNMLPNDHSYYTQTKKNDEPSKFLYIKK